MREWHLDKRVVEGRSPRCELEGDAPSAPILSAFKKNMGRHGGHSSMLNFMPFPSLPSVIADF